MPFGRKKKDELGKKRDKNKQVPYVKCNHQRKYKAANGSIITVFCTKNRNLPHRHD
jgi:hypothetical protein